MWGGRGLNLLIPVRYFYNLKTELKLKEDISFMGNFKTKILELFEKSPSKVLCDFSRRFKNDN